MKRQWILGLLLAVLAFASPAFAQMDQGHLVGTVTMHRAACSRRHRYGNVTRAHGRAHRSHRF